MDERTHVERQIGVQGLAVHVQFDKYIEEADAMTAKKEEEVMALVEQIESTIGPIEVLVFNIGANVACSILEETARKYFKIWEMACFSGFLNGREVAKRMVARQRGTIIFTGASASLRGREGFAAQGFGGEVNRAGILRMGGAWLEAEQEALVASRKRSMLDTCASCITC
jgi:NAD(P)-dependent dehydrogenase (short-subunit alcohol dehydrogenase family)